MNRDSVLQQLIAYPDDHDVRQVYADVLSEAGDALGEFMAVQVALARHESPALRARERELLRAHHEHWFGDLERFLRERNAEQSSTYETKWGFVDHVRVHLTGDDDELDTLFGLAPLMRSLEVNGEGLRAHDALRRVRRLCVTGLGGALSDLIRQGYFDELEVLDLQLIDGMAVTSLGRLKSLQAFHSTWVMRDLPALPRQLRVLDGYGEALVRTQLGSPRKALRELTVRSAVLEPDTIDDIARQAEFLERLTFKMSTLPSALLTRLFRHEWPKLARLELHGVNVGPAGARVLAELSAPNLRELELPIAQLGDEGFKALLGAPWFSQLTSLNVSANRVTDVGLAPLLRMQHSLEQLNLLKNRIPGDVGRRLADVPSLASTNVMW